MTVILKWEIKIILQALMAYLARRIASLKKKCAYKVPLFLAILMEAVLRNSSPKQQADIWSFKKYILESHLKDRIQSFKPFVYLISKSPPWSFFLFFWFGMNKEREKTADYVYATAAMKSE